MIEQNSTIHKVRGGTGGKSRRERDREGEGETQSTQDTGNKKRQRETRDRDHKEQETDTDTHRHKHTHGHTNNINIKTCIFQSGGIIVDWPHFPTLINLITGRFHCIVVDGIEPWCVLHLLLEWQ